ncbi:hypothetical protein QE152_g19526 [Popillia japonica]|uniref:Uncharacterized protein n=1 Tax=Popillia japonica TaxID=7064 RepID=A0AAW1KRJ6_POPJA
MQKRARQVDKRHEKKMLEGSMPGTRYKHLGRRIQDSHQKFRFVSNSLHSSFNNRLWAQHIETKENIQNVIGGKIQNSSV